MGEALGEREAYRRCEPDQADLVLEVPAPVEVGAHDVLDAHCKSGQLHRLLLPLPFPLPLPLPLLVAPVGVGIPARRGPGRPARARVGQEPAGVEARALEPEPRRKRRGRGLVHRGVRGVLGADRGDLRCWGGEKGVGGLVSCLRGSEWVVAGPSGQRLTVLSRLGRPPGNTTQSITNFDQAIVLRASTATPPKTTKPRPSSVSLPSHLPSPTATANSEPLGRADGPRRISTHPAHARRNTVARKRLELGEVDVSALGGMGLGA